MRVACVCVCMCVHARVCERAIARMYQLCVCACMCVTELVCVRKSESSVCE